MTKKDIVFHFLFLLFISIWLVATLSVILNDYSTNQAFSSSSPFAGYFEVFYWSIVGVTATISFALGLDKLGIVEILRSVFSEDKGYDPEIYVALPKSQPIESTATSVVEEQSVIEQNNVTASIADSNILPKQDSGERSKDGMKAFYLFGETEFRNCEHKFGYLGSELKNKPIPDECFGCPKVLECFKSKQS